MSLCRRGLEVGRVLLAKDRIAVCLSRLLTVRHGSAGAGTDQSREPAQAGSFGDFLKGSKKVSLPTSDKIIYFTLF